MADTKRNGKIITFYSYKGGTGRSMTLANVAWILASQGKHVLVLDWDLEAPGLHRYFSPFLLDKNLTSSEGIIDFVQKFTAAAAISPNRKEQEKAPAGPPGGNGPEATKEGADEWYKPYANILRYASSLNWEFNNKGTLDFIPAGRQGPSYPTRVNSFNWDHFYNKLGGGTLLELAKERMREEYDYVLIDSRTGVSDTSGICTIQMPDILVICFTLNNQSIDGASAVAHDVFEKRLNPSKAKEPSDSGGGQPEAAEGVQIFPVPMRIENAEKVKLQARKNYARDKFKLFPNSLPPEERESYWGNVPVTYIPFYAYEEILATFGDDPADRVSVLAAAEQLTSYLTNHTVKKLAPPSEDEGRKVLKEFEGGIVLGDPAIEEDRFAESVFALLCQEDQESARRLLTRLVRAARPEEVGGDSLLRVNIDDIAEQTLKVLRPLLNASLVQKETDAATGREVVKISSATLIKNWKRLRGWIDEDRNFLLWRQRLQLKASEWEAGGRETGSLLSGSLLQEAQRYLESREIDVTSAEAEYIRASSRQEEITTLSEEQKPFYKTKGFRLISYAILALAVIAFAIQLFNIFAARSDDKKDKSVQLAAYSNVATDPELSVLLAIEAVRTERSSQAEDALRDSLRDFRQTAVLRGHIDKVYSAAFSSDGKQILTGSSDGTAIVWQQAGDTWQVRTKLDPNIGYVQSAAFSPDNQFVAVGGYAKIVKVFEAATGKEVNSLATLTGVLHVSFSPDGRFIVAGTTGDSAFIWDWKGSATGKSLASPGHTDDINSAAYSPDGKYIVTASSDGTVIKWDAVTLNRIMALTGHTREVYSAVFSPDSRLIVSASEDGTARVWDVPTGKEILRLTGHNGSVWAASFSPNGKLIVTGGADNTVRLWDAGAGQQRTILRGHLGSVYSAAFSPDGRQVVTGSADNTARVWDVSGDFSVGNSVDELIQQGCKKLSRNLTQEEWQRYMAGEAYRKTCENLPTPKSSPAS